MKKQAVLLSGGINFRANYERYKNDLEFVYSVLLEKCGFCEEDIIIFYANGTSIDYKGKAIQTRATNRQNIMQELEHL